MNRPTKTDLFVLLQARIGRKWGVTAAVLAIQLECSPRTVRALVTELRNDAIAVCGHPATGYFVAETKAELEETCAFLRSRAMHSLTLESKLRGMPLADLVGQLHLKT